MTRSEQLFTWFAVLTVFGTTAAGASEAKPPPTPAPPAAVASVLDADQTLLVWTGKADATMGSGLEAERAAAASVTRFIRPDDTEISNLPGLFVAVENELYKWSTNLRSLKPSRCEGQENPYHERTLREAALVSVASGQRLTVVNYYRSNADDTPYAEQHTPTALFGNTLFVRSDREFYKCGVHPQYGSTFTVFRLKPGNLRRTNIDELIPAASARISEADAKLREGSLNEGNIEISMIFPEFGPTGAQWVAQYTAAVPWAMSDGLWSGYTRSERMRLSPKAKANTIPSTAPDALIRYLRTHPEVRVYGFSIGKNLCLPIAHPHANCAVPSHLEDSENVTPLAFGYLVAEIISAST
jgi:hypothetical protein